MSKVLLISGHGAGDPGAIGCNYKENELAIELVDLIASRLRNYVDVDVYPHSKNAYKDVKNGTFKASGYTYVLEVHFNASNNSSANGTECFVTTKEGSIKVEKHIMKHMGEFFKLRDNDKDFDGVKRTNWLVINTCKKRGMSSCLLETCFITNQTDMARYQAHKAKIADGIVCGIIEEFGWKKKAAEPVKVETPKQATSKPKYTKGTYQVTASDLIVRKGPGTTYAKVGHSKLTKDGKKHDKDKDGGLDKGTRITVLEVNGNWGRCPSGWVCLDYCKKV